MSRSDLQRLSCSLPPPSTIPAIAHPELCHLREQLRSIHNAMGSFGSSHLAAKPPILDISKDLGPDGNEEFHSHQDAVHGLRALRDAVRRDLDVLEKFLNDPGCASLPPLSTNAPYLISVWNEVLHAKPPIVTIWRTFLESDQTAHVPRRGSRKPAGVKVDVVAESGKRWIRINTMKNSRLLAEFREIDSYMTDSEDEEDESGRDSLAPKEFDNSIMRMGRSLLEAARRNPLPGSESLPTITLRLTRLDPNPPDIKEHDPRIAKTIDLLRHMGINVEFGERDPDKLPAILPTVARHLEPTIRVNLDLSILIALVSDITHSPLPTSPAEAGARYVPSAQYLEWKRKRLEASKRPEEPIDETRFGPNGVGKHSRALADQALQEMERGLLHELRDRLISVSSPNLENVEFWTTPEARDRCLRIVLSKIGGPNEKRRATALFPSADLSVSQAEQQYWENSRYVHAFLPLVPIKVFPTPVPPPEMEPAPLSHDGPSLSPFFKLLAHTCREILAQDTIPVPPPLIARWNEGGDNEQDVDVEEIERAAIMKANPRLTAHTVQSMLWGAAQGWTTLTANKSSVKAILREIRASEGGYGWVEPAARNAPEAHGDNEECVREKVALWVVDPRSLAEGMRSDYVESQ